MVRRLAGALAVVVGCAMSLPVVALAADPATSTWSASSIGPVSADPCVATYGLASCERPGGLVADGARALIVQVDGGHVVTLRSTDGGATWGGEVALTPGTASQAPSVASDLGVADVAYFVHATDSVGYRESTDLGAHWSAVKGFAAPRRVWQDTAIARNDEVLAIAASGFDEVPRGRPGAAITVRVVPKMPGGRTATHTLAWNGSGCPAMGTDPSLAITVDNVVVLAYWQTCTRLVVRRSTDLGQSWTAPQTLSGGRHTVGTAIAARGSVVLLASTAGGTTFVRRSTDNGRTWAAPVAAGVGATSVRLAWVGGAWHLLSGGADMVDDRTSADGALWSDATPVVAAAGARTYALGIAGSTTPVAAYVVRTPDKITMLGVALDQ